MTPTDSKEAFAQCLAVATNKHQELAALHLLDALTAERDTALVRVAQLEDALKVTKTWMETLVDGTSDGSALSAYEVVRHALKGGAE